MSAVSPSMCPHFRAASRSPAEQKDIHDDIHTVNADGSGLERLTSGEDREFDPTWSPDGQSIAYRHQTGDDSTTDIFVMDADGSHFRNLTGSGGLGDWGPGLVARRGVDRLEHCLRGASSSTWA